MKLSSERADRNRTIDRNRLHSVLLVTLFPASVTSAAEHAGETAKGPWVEAIADMFDRDEPRPFIRSLDDQREYVIDGEGEYLQFGLTMVAQHASDLR